MQINYTKMKNLSIMRLIKLFAVILSILSVFTIFDDIHRLLELFSHFKHQYLTASIIFCLMFFMLRDNKWGYAMIMIAALNFSYILPWYINTKDKAVTEHTAEIKLVQSNVHTNNTNYQALVDLVFEESPDIFIAQEVNQQWVDKLSQLITVLPYTKIESREDNFGIAVYSKYPFDIAEVVNLGDSDIPSLKMTFRLNQQPISMITTHPLPPINNIYYEHRNAQLKSVSKIVKTIETPLIVIGDLNVTMWSKDYQSIEQETNLSNTRKGFGILPTWPANLLPFMIPIDHCLVSSEFEVLDISVGRDIGSDHLPLIVILGLKLNKVN